MVDLGAGTYQPSPPAAGARPEVPPSLGTGAPNSDPRPRCAQREPSNGNGVRPGVGLQDATYTRACQKLATDWVYQMSYAEMYAWRWNKMLDRNYLRRHYSLDHDPDRDGAGGWPPIPAPIPPPPLPVPPGR